MFAVAAPEPDHARAALRAGARNPPVDRTVAAA